MKRSFHSSGNQGYDEGLLPPKLYATSQWTDYSQVGIVNHCNTLVNCCKDTSCFHGFTNEFFILVVLFLLG